MSELRVVDEWKLCYKVHTVLDCMVLISLTAYVSCVMSALNVISLVLACSCTARSQEHADCRW